MQSMWTYRFDKLDESHLGVTIRHHFVNNRHHGQHKRQPGLTLHEGVVVAATNTHVANNNVRQGGGVAAQRGTYSSATDTNSMYSSKDMVGVSPGNLPRPLNRLYTSRRGCR